MMHARVAGFLWIVLQPGNWQKCYAMVGRPEPGSSINNERDFASILESERTG
jgi:hypothetical protein